MINSMDKIKWLIFIVVVIGVLTGIVLLNKSDQSAFTGDASKVITEGPIADHTYGSESQKVVLVEYGDYQCPYCGAAYPVLKEIMKEYGNKIQFVFRNFPLSEMHKYARPAAIVAEAATLQGKFWEMHDAIFENQEYYQKVMAP